MNLSYFAYQFIADMVKNQQKKTILEPWTRREFSFAELLLRSPQKDFTVISDNFNRENSLSMGEFILMELYRLGDVDEDTISMLKSTYMALVCGSIIKLVIVALVTCISHHVI